MKDCSHLPPLVPGVPGGITNAKDPQLEHGWLSQPIPVSEVETPRTRELRKLLKFVPTTRAEMEARGWKGLDILLISGDAYVDHPSFGIPLLARLLIREGYRVGIIAQPVYPGFTGPRGQAKGSRAAANEAEALADFRRMGAPRLFVGVSAGVVDSMINNYTANKKPRSDDMYSPGGAGGYRPDYASIVYSKLARKAFAGVPVIAGGVEASLRRLAHYDYWQNRVRPSILVELDCDLAVFGMGERQALRIAGDLKRAREEAPGQQGTLSWAEAALKRLRNERGIAYVSDKEAARVLPHRLTLPSFEEVRDDKKKFARAAYHIELESNPYNAKTLVQHHGNKAVVINPPPLPLTTPELDSLYELPFSKEAHFSYQEKAERDYGRDRAAAAQAAKIPAAEMIRFSLAVNRGCFGGCSFCAITLHQGRVVQSRSESSVLKELRGLGEVPGFTGVVSDLGGPTANMYMLRCKSESVQSMCRKLSCVAPRICPHLVTDHAPQTRLLRQARETRGIRKVFIASGLRYDLALQDKEYLREVLTHHVGGHLKVAPEHTDPEILALMKKPPFELFCEFREEFEKISREAGKEQYLVPYFISSFPGTTDEKMEQVFDWLQDEGWRLQQVQGFIPTPMTLATAMFWSGFDPASRRPLHVAKDLRARKVHQALLQPQRPENRQLVSEYRARKRRREQARKQEAARAPQRQKPDFSSYGYGKGSGE
ncbi:MAG: YgiQ family radical SAM protein [Oligoflexia bacterium]|nr:YgiQ family radical SAM protein [Oligoflexia bacterium]